MDDLVKLHTAQQPGERRRVGDIPRHELKLPGQGLDFAKVRLLDARAVEIIEIVQCPDRVAGPEQLLANMRANKTGAAGDEDVHVGTVSNEGPAVERPARIERPQPRGP